MEFVRNPSECDVAIVSQQAGIGQRKKDLSALAYRRGHLLTASGYRIPAAAIAFLTTKCVIAFWFPCGVLLAPFWLLLVPARAPIWVPFGPCWLYFN